MKLELDTLVLEAWPLNKIHRDLKGATEGRYS